MLTEVFEAYVQFWNAMQRFPIEAVRLCQKQ